LTLGSNVPTPVAVVELVETTYGNEPPPVAVVEPVETTMQQRAYAHRGG
jgi:hypothetical protein